MNPSFAGIKDLCETDMVPAVKAHVALHKGESTHWEINAEGDVQVTVMTASGGELTPILATGVPGVWSIPPLGAEVIVVFPDGDFEGDAILVATLAAGGGAPPDLTGTNVVVMGPQVLITDGQGGTEPVVRKSEYDGHTHGPGTFANSSGSVTGISGGAAAVAGTSILQAK